MKMLIYLDVCCFNRPFDDQRSARIYIETEAKLFVQDAIKQNVVDMCWSYMLTYENAANPDRERREAIARWQALARLVILENGAILQRATELHALGFGTKDALHLSCAIDANAAFFLTTDNGIVRKKHLVPDVRIVNPTEFLYYLDESR
jgi:predicted nucleic acid-binding protein